MCSAPSTRMSGEISTFACNHKPKLRRTGETSQNQQLGLDCGARFVAYYGSDDENIETVEVRSCGLCHSDEYKRDHLKGATIQLIAQVTARR